MVSGGYRPNVMIRVNCNLLIYKVVR